ncbi:MAG: hypothetical protein ACK448_10140 [Bacteroidota bacterium]|jgi:hypothetical protein
MISQLIQTAISCAKIAIRSKYFLPLYQPKIPTIVILGTGPSAKSALEYLKTNTVNTPLLAVNKFSCQPDFFQLKPSYYLMLDMYFFDFTENVYINPAQHPIVAFKPDFEQTQTMINETWEALKTVDWPITFFVPQLYNNTFIVNHLRKTNKNITFITYNYTVINGFNRFKNWIYNQRLGSPQCENVINSCIMTCIQNGFSTIYFAGADHNFHININVADDNTIIRTESHFYEDKNLKHPLLKQNPDGTTGKITLKELFHSLVKVHAGYEETRRYGDYKGISIYNLTPGGYVDAFERRPIESLEKG